MLTPSELLLVAEGISEIWEEFEEEALKDLAERLWANQGWSATSASRYESLQEMNLYYGYIQKKIAEKLNISEQAVRELMQNAIEASISRDNMIYEEAYSLELIPEFTPKLDRLNSIITQGIRATNNEIRNFTREYAGELNEMYRHYLDLAYLNTQSGLMSSKEAAQYSIQQLINLGVTVISPNGRKERPETIVRRAVRTGINQTASKCQEENFFQFGGTLVEVSSHLGARPSHAVWQGGVYEWVKAGEKKKTDYPDFIATTGYGTGEGLCGWNCRHSFFPFFEGISERSFERYDLKENEEVYKLQQEQKYNERMIRKYTNEAQILEAGRLDSSAARANAAAWTKKNNHLIRENSRFLKKDHSNVKAFLSNEEALKRQINSVVLDSYWKSVQSGKISALVTQETYFSVYDQLKEQLIGIATSDGRKVEAFSLHLIERVIGQYEDSAIPIKGMRKGVPVVDVIDCLKNGTTNGKIKTRPDGKTSILYVTEKCKVSFNPVTNVVIQTNPR